MSSHGSGTAGRIAEFNETLARTDGGLVAGVLQEMLSKDQVAWLDDLVLPLFRGAAWPDQAANESRCRHEVSMFQAVEAGNIARDRSWIR